MIVGKALKKHNIPRNKVVILSKVYFPIDEGEGTRVPPINDGAAVNQMGLSRKHIFDAVDGCLRRLDMDYIGKLNVVSCNLCPHALSSPNRDAFLNRGRQVVEF